MVDAVIVTKLINSFSDCEIKIRGKMSYFIIMYCHLKSVSLCTGS